MAVATVNGLNIAYDIIGDKGPFWILTPGGRFAPDTPGVPQLAEAVAAKGNRVIIWDRPNCGESDVSFDASNESNLNADALAALVAELGAGPAIVIAGSAGIRVSLLAEQRHPGTARAMALWWPSGGAFELFVLGNVYCVPNLRAAYSGGMEAVAALADWGEQIRKNPATKERILSQDPKQFIETMERWLEAFIPRPAELIPGLQDTDLAKIDVPTLVFQSSEIDANHPKWVSQKLADALPNSTLVDPPWGDREWWDMIGDQAAGIFRRWPLLAPQLTSWVEQTVGAPGSV